VGTPDDQHGAGRLCRKRIEVGGQVQGVGFRPFVYRLACQLGLGGFVANDSHGAQIEIEGPADALETFTVRLREQLPPLARITRLRQRTITPRNQQDFQIHPSRRDGAQDAAITPDAAVCADCLRELFDPNDRRYRYPFINCTNCGPRYSIILSIPYDRPNTTMAKFRMCPACQAEYDDPANRRFHAQPNACPACGPRIWLTDAEGREQDGDPIRRAAALLRAGRIVAVKGIGGFHLACRADIDEPVRRLRSRKQRESKPLAMMVPDMEAARALAVLNAADEALLTGAVRPIVLAPKRATAAISELVAPGTPCFGLMLPYAPVHYLLFAEGLGPLVMTSGNPSDEPLTSDNNEALERLGRIADAFLLHNRDIERPVDDSVVFTFAQRTVSIRRARGYVPQAIVTSHCAAEPILAVGGELKCTVCLLDRREAVLSEHIGDLKKPVTYRHFLGTIERLQQILRRQPAVIAHDLHPHYLSTQYATQQPLRRVAVQHHHAHIVSCLADACEDGPVIGLACDGTGYGPDGAIWGCELLVCDACDFERLGHLDYYALPGGDAAAHETWRPALSLLLATFGRDWPEAAENAFRTIDPDKREFVSRMIEHGVHAPATSSLGRLFDAVAFLLGLCQQNRHEAQAAMALEAAATAGPFEPYPYRLPTRDGRIRFDVRPMMAAILDDLAKGTPTPTVAGRFHETIAALLAQAAVLAAEQTGLRIVALSGGCFVNRHLLRGCTERLARAGLGVLTHHRVPAGDGGLSLGQAVVAAARSTPQAG